VDEAKRQRILDAAMAVFVECGYKDAAIDEIARRADIAKGTVYLACESKADLFYQVVHRDLQAWAAQIARFVDPRKPASEILSRMAHNGITYIAEHPLVRGLFSGAHQGLLPDWTDRFEQLRTMGRADVAEVLRMGVRSGEFRADIDVEEFAAILQDLTHTGYVLYGDRWVTDPKIGQKRIAGVLDLALNGLRKR
jgi:AcrR family transcriptional regulator